MSFSVEKVDFEAQSRLSVYIEVSPTSYVEGELIHEAAPLGNDDLTEVASGVRLLCVVDVQ